MTTDPKQFTKVLEALDLAELEPEEQEEILLDLNDLIFKGTLLRLIERMDAKTRDHFMELIENNAQETELESFIEQNVPDADSAVTETLQELTDDILAVTK